MVTARTRAVFSYVTSLLLFSALPIAHAASVTLAWNRAVASGLAGYHLYTGVSSGNYTSSLNVGNQTNATISGLTTGARYYFAVTSYTSNGLESAFSNEISYTPTNSTSTNLLPTVVLTAPANGSSYTAPANVSLSASVTANGHTITKVQFFKGTTLLAEDTATPYTFTWSGVSAGSYALSAKVVYDSGSAVSSPTVNVTVTTATGSSLSFASTSGTITSPFVANNGLVYQTTSTAVTTGGRAAYSFTLPSSGNYIISAMTIAPNSGANSFYVNIDAEPTDPTMIWDVPITATLTSSTVSWRGTGTDTSDQFVPKVFALSAGTHQLIIRGREANTQLGTITISPASSTTPPPTPPAIVLTAPNNNASYVAPANLALAATVTPNGHTITKVQFLNGSTILGESAAAPYSFSWNNVGAGNYSLSARAVYDAGSLVSSASANVSVTNPVASSLTFAASSGTISSPFVLYNGEVSQSTTTGTIGAGRAVYTFTVPTTGDYLVSANVNAPNTGANSFYVNIDSDPTDPYMVWDMAVTTGFTKQTVSWRGSLNTLGTPGADQFTPKVFNLTQGTHRLIILGREGGSQFSSITIAPFNVLPPPWQAIDIGNVGITGKSFSSAGGYAIAGAGNLSGSSDNFRFLFQPMSGDGDLRANITSLQNSTVDARGGIIMRETLTPGSKYAFMGMSPDGTIRSQTRTATLSGSSSVTAGVGTAPNIWTRLVRTGNAVLGYKSTDGATWTLVSSNSLTMATNIYFGLAVASGTTNALSAGGFTNVLAIP